MSKPFRFGVGDKVVVCGLVPPDQAENGRVGAVISRVRDEWIDPLGNEGPEANLYLLDIYCGTEYPLLEEHNLAPYDPPGDWGDCAWQPAEITHKEPADMTP